MKKKLNEDQFTVIMNERVEQLFDLYPIEDLKAVEVSEDMKDGLARSYAHKGMRNYLENAVKIALKSMAIAPTPLEIAYFKSRIDTLEQLLAKGKQVYTQIEIAKELRKVGAHNAT
jgi:hypothetical protein